MPLIALDTETGGFHAASCALLSITAVELDADLVPRNTLDLYLQPEPGKEISAEAARINGYTPEKWEEKRAVPLRLGIKRLAEWLPFKSEALAHNAGFDKAFVDQGATDAGQKVWLHPRWRCSMVAFLAVNDALGLGAKDAKLETLARMAGHWGPEYERGAHASLDDAIACAAGWRWLRDRIRQGAASATRAGGAA